MASGILGQSVPSATTLTTVYTVPGSTHTIANVNVLNRSASNPVNVRIALSASGTPTDAEYIEFDATVFLQRVFLERTAISLQAKLVVVYCSTGDTSVSVYGLEQSA